VDELSYRATEADWMRPEGQEYHDHEYHDDEYHDHDVIIIMLLV
jgi:hypothetical protein